MPRYEDLMPVARPILAELRDMGPQSSERLRDLLMFDEGKHEDALTTLLKLGLVGQHDDVVRATAAGINVIDREREPC